ncbi:hypothetical protein BG006_000407 [Podila minutissima]|uniref:Peptidyl-prolyl isomerase CWC27 n=1 Tax=Podila minutissima TaxID=64525 RepID=A0A9P5VHA4_9FUNG|nr:hypothetical protein BG006_000407 [Podila minutissima]
MSNIYLLEPHTSGKVILHTSDGDIAIELWPKEAPKACRNFIQLCMEGYYTNTIFHRIVAGFIIQGGDPEGTGEGGESVFEDGQPFADEFHSRLRFVRRGLVAMANSGQPNDNRSQFFITLDATPELQNKHTIFGKIGGDTIFNVLKIGSLEVDANERPLYPPTVTGCTIVVNPFDDIVPRISRQEQEAARLRELEAQKKPEKQKKQKKNVALLSFADDAPDEDGENSEAPQRKKMMSSHDLLDEDPTLSKEVDSSLLVDLESKPSKSFKSKKPRDEPKEESRKESRRDEDEQESFNDFDKRMRDQVRSKQDALQKKSKTSHESGSRPSDSPLATSKPDTSSSLSAPSQPLTAREKTQQEIQKLESDIRRMHNRDSDDDDSSKKNKAEKISYLQLEREQYKTRKELSGDLARNKRAKAQASADKEREMLEKLSAFERKVSVMAREPEPNPAPKKNDAPPCKIHGVPSCESFTPKSKRKQSGSDGEEDKEKELGEEDEGDDSDDNDIGWMQHKLMFEKDLKGKEVSLSAKRDDVNDYIVIDPLNKAIATSKAIAMEKERNQDKRRKQNHYADKDSRGGRDGGSDRDRKSRDGRDDRRPYDRPSSSSSSRRDDRDRSDRHSDSRGSGRRDDYKDDYRREPGRANRDRW